MFTTITRQWNGRQRQHLCGNCWMGKPAPLLPARSLDVFATLRALIRGLRHAKAQKQGIARLGLIPLRLGVLAQLPTLRLPSHAQSARPPLSETAHYADLVFAGSMQEEEEGALRKEELRTATALPGNGSNVN